MQKNLEKNPVLIAEVAVGLLPQNTTRQYKKKTPKDIVISNQRYTLPFTGIIELFLKKITNKHSGGFRIVLRSIGKLNLEYLPKNNFQKFDIR